MGVYDTFVGWSNCSHCEQLNQVDIQFKGFDSSMATYTVGDFVGGHEPYAIFTDEDIVCETCQQLYTTYVLGKMGVVYGFCNEEEFEEIKKILPFGKDNTYVSFMVSKEWLDCNAEEALNRLREMYMENPLETDFVVVDEQIDAQILNELICRIPSFVKNPHHRPDIGEAVFVDNRSSVYQLWHLQNEKVIIIDRLFRERTQDYVYSVRMPDGSTMDNIPEAKLADEKRRNDLLAMLKKVEDDILTCCAMQNRPRNEKEERMYTYKKTIIKLHYRGLVEEMKQVGTLPQDFTFET